MAGEQLQELELQVSSNSIPFTVNYHCLPEIELFLESIALENLASFTHSSNIHFPLTKSDQDLNASKAPHNLPPVPELMIKDTHGSSTNSRFVSQSCCLLLNVSVYDFVFALL